MAHLTNDPSNEARWICIYPPYIDKTLTLAQGRRIPKETVRLLPFPSDQHRLLHVLRGSWQIGVR